MTSVYVSLPVELVERLAPARLEAAQEAARALPTEGEREAWIAGNLGIFIAQALHEISVLLDQVAAE